MRRGNFRLLSKNRFLAQEGVLGEQRPCEVIFRKTGKYPDWSRAAGGPGLGRLNQDIDK